MQGVSQGWKDNQKQTIVSESFVELVYEIGDPDSLADTSAADNGAEPFSNTALTVNEIDENMARYAMFEKNLWKMDGSMKLLPETGPYTGTGYVGNKICDDDGLFETNPVITVTFSQVYSKLIPGITIRWSEAYGDYADTFKVTAYNGTNEVANTTVTGNTEPIASVPLDIINYNKITVEILKWGNPNRRARIEEIFVGVKRVYGKSDLLSYQHSMFVDLLSAKLPKAEIKFSLSNVDGIFNPFNPESESRYLMERQRIIVKYGYKINGAMEWIKAGGFYMSEWDTPQNGITASFTARDLLEFMSGAYSGPLDNTSLYDIALAALTQAHLPRNRDGSVKWVIDPSLQSIQTGTVVFQGNKEPTIAEILQMVANAGCCVMYQDRNEKLHIEPMNAMLTDYTIDRFNSYSNSELKLSKKLKSVNVNKGAAVVENDTDGEVQNVDNPLIPAVQVAAVGQWVKDTLKGRMTLTGEYRADPRLDALDEVTISNKYADSTVIVTDITYTYNGAFRGKYEGRSMDA
jgi:hypothetical protein